MKVIVFKNRFEEPILSGVKTHTIRPPRKRKIQVGDNLSLRVWTGRPYMSRQRLLLDTICTALNQVKIAPGTFIFVDRKLLDWADVKKLAHRDGFVDEEDMMAWFHAMHGLPFEGEMISWAVKGETHGNGKIRSVGDH